MHFQVEIKKDGRKNIFRDNKITNKADIFRC